MATTDAREEAAVEDMVEAAARALAVAHDADSCFDPLVPNVDGHISEDSREVWESGAEDREHFRQGARAVLLSAAEHFERRANRAPSASARELALWTADQVRPTR